MKKILRLFPLEMDFAKEAADRVVVFDQGDIIETGVPEEIFKKTPRQRGQGFF